MADAGSIKFTLKAVTKQFDAAMARARGQLESVSGELAGIGATAGVAFGALAGGMALATKKYSDHAERLNVIQVAFGEFAGEAQAWATSFADATNRSSSELLGFAGSFQSILSPMLGGAEAAKDMSMQLTELAIDFGSFKNLRPEEAFQKLRSGIVGEAEPLRDLGIVMDEATLKSFALSQGITKSVESMTGGEKTALRFKAIVAQSTLAMHDAANTSMSLANLMVGLDSKIQDVGVSFGEIFEPYAKKALVALIDWLKWLRDLPKQTKASLVGIGAIAAAVAGFIAAIAAAGIVIPAFVSGVGAIGVAMKAMTTLASGAIVKLISFGAANTVAGANVPTLTAQIAALGKALKGMAVVAGAALSKLMMFTAAGAAFASIIGGIANISAMIEARSAGRAAFDEQVKSMGMDPNAGFGTLMMQGLKANLTTGIDIMFGGIGEALTDTFEGLGKKILSFVDTASEETAADIKKNVKPSGAGADASIDFSKLDTEAMYAAAGESLDASDRRAFDMGRATRQEQVDRLSAVDPSRFTVGQQAMIGLDGAIDTISGKLGKAGEVMNSFAQGFSKGGIIGGVINALASLIVETNFFKMVTEQVNRTIGRLIEMIDRILQPFQGLIGMVERFDDAGLNVIMSLLDILFRLLPISNIIDGLTRAMDGLAKVVQFFANVLDAVGEHLKKIGELFSKGLGLDSLKDKLTDWGRGVTDNIQGFFGLKKSSDDLAEAANAVVVEFQKIAAPVFDEVLKDMSTSDISRMIQTQDLTPDQKTRVEAELNRRIKEMEDSNLLARMEGRTPRNGLELAGLYGLLEYLATLDPKVFEDMPRRDPVEGFFETVTEAAEGAAEGLKELEKATDEVLNAPEGIKLALNRFRAIQRDDVEMAAAVVAMPASTPTPEPAAEPTPVTPIIIEHATIVTEDPEDFVAQVNEVNAFNATTSGTASTSSVMGESTPAPAPPPRAHRVGGYVSPTGQSTVGISTQGNRRTRG